MLYLHWSRFQKFSNLLEIDDNICSIHSCHTGYSARSWSKPPRGMAPLLSEERRQASTSRLWGHFECSDLWGWCLEYPVSPWTGDMRKGKKEKKKGKVPRGSGVNGDWVSWERNEAEVGADIAAWCHMCARSDAQLDKGRHTHTHTLTHTRARWVIDEPFSDGDCTNDQSTEQRGRNQNYYGKAKRLHLWVVRFAQCTCTSYASLAGHSNLTLSVYWSVAMKPGQ